MKFFHKIRKTVIQEYDVPDFHHSVLSHQLRNIMWQWYPARGIHVFVLHINIESCARLSMLPKTLYLRQYSCYSQPQDINTQ
ncbi:hypothetical protein T12_2665 [Trichinella patagoniensis]|uniref:Uncharacterized protein n=1 Tax=Trichinella patagoniensis TaxID=990121 RepID=A0A0V0Z5M3_9BILA|nr:hypothetical protein T12_16386 [Trichinella patagoniensis]KRY07746.1 hypothetical protein T12_2665 [Trichinella patagoniensis]